MEKFGPFMTDTTWNRKLKAWGKSSANPVKRPQSSFVLKELQAR